MTVPQSLVAKSLVAKSLVAKSLVVGSYPPVPGAPAAATVAAVRRAWAAGREVVVVSPRPSAAPLVLRAAGPRGIAREVARLGRRHGCDGVVLCLEPGWPLRRRSESGARSLAAALSSFRYVEVVMTGGTSTDASADWGLLAPIWRAAEPLIASSEEVAAFLRTAGALAVEVCDPFEGAGLHGPFSPAGTVPPLEHGELLLRVRARRLLGALARQLLGRRAPAVRAYIWHLASLGRRDRRTGGTAKPSERAAKPSGRRRFAWMGISYSSVVEAPLAEVFAWHTRPGALARLSPPWLPGKVVSEASSLRDGQAVLRFPGGVRWVAQHRPDGYDPPHAFVDEVTSMPFAAFGWRHAHAFRDAGGTSTRTDDEVRTPVPATVLRPMFGYRHRQLAADLASHARGRSWRTEPLTVAMTGSSGLIGSALAAFLTTGGHSVVRLVRHPPTGPGERQWDPDNPGPRLLDGVDAVVHLAGASIAGRFSARHKRAVMESRSGPTRRLAEAAAAAAEDGGGPSVFVSASAIGYYGYDRGDEILTEASSQGDGFLADVVARWEEATAPAGEAGLRVVKVRTGIVQSPRGGVLGLLYPVFLLGLGGRLGSGRQWTSWTGIDDLVDVYYRALLDPTISGPVNAVSPQPVRNDEYTATLGRVLDRPTVLAVPGFAADLALGPEGRREVAEASQRVEPTVLLAAGHHFRHPELEGALRHLLGKVVG